MNDLLAQGLFVMDEPKVYMDETNVHVCKFSLAQVMVVMNGHTVYMAEPKVHI
jgi:hypothetical protein